MAGHISQFIEGEMHCFLELLLGFIFVDLVKDDILQMALRSDLLRKFGGRVLHTLLTNALCCTSRQLVAMPLSTKIIHIAPSQKTPNLLSEFLFTGEHLFAHLTNLSHQFLLSFLSEHGV